LPCPYRDRKLTLTQNYRRLGLTSRLNVPTGGVEKVLQPGSENNAQPIDPLHASILGRRASAQKPKEARVERDPETGRILRVIHDEDEDEEMIEVAGRKLRKSNPLNDPLEELPEDGESMTVSGSAPSAVVAELEREAAAQEEELKKKTPRQQSKREVEWLQRLVDKHGDDTRAMARDMKLNPMQQTEADIAKRLRKWRGVK
jgi:nucleolar protein 16